MIRLELSDEEAAQLKTILGEFLTETRFETARTDTADYKERLRHVVDLAASICEHLDRELKSRGTTAA